METLLRHIVSSAVLPSEWGIYVCSVPSGGKAIIVGRALNNNIEIAIRNGVIVVCAKSCSGDQRDLSDQLGHGYHELFTR